MKIHALLFCKFVGRDEFGNTYYLSRAKNYWGVNKRFCRFNGRSDMSKIPGIWKDWMTYKISSWELDTRQKPNYSWILPHLPNLSLSKYKFVPFGSANYSVEFDITNKNSKQPRKVELSKYWTSWCRDDA